MSKTVIITETLDKACADWLKDNLPGDVQLVWCSHQAKEFASLLGDAVALVVRTYTKVNQELLDAAPNLKVVGRAGVGLDNFDLAACEARGVQVVYTPQANTQAVVELVFALIFDAIRPREYLPGYITPEIFHEMRTRGVGLQIDELTVGILGFGRIGKRVGKAAYGLGVNKILVNDLLPADKLQPLVDYPFEFVDKASLFAQADILTIHIDGRGENRAIIDSDVLSQLKPSCLLINAARGMLVDNIALATWARNVADAGGKVVLDVHDPEPMPEDYPLYGIENVAVLPHIAARTKTALLNMSWVVKDIAAVLKNDKAKFRRV